MSPSQAIASQSLIEDVTDPVILSRTLGFRSVSVPASAQGRDIAEWTQRSLVGFQSLARSLGMPPRAMGVYGRLGLVMPPRAEWSFYPRHIAASDHIVVGAHARDVVGIWVNAVDRMLYDCSQEAHPGHPAIPWGPNNAPWYASNQLKSYCQSGARGDERFHILTPAILRQRLQDAPVSPREPDLLKNVMGLALSLRWRSQNGRIQPTPYFLSCQKAEGRKTNQPYWSSPSIMVSRAITAWCAHHLAASDHPDPWVAHNTLQYSPKPLPDEIRIQLKRNLADLMPLMERQMPGLLVSLRSWAEQREHTTNVWEESAIMEPFGGTSPLAHPDLLTEMRDDAEDSVDMLPR